VNINLEKGFAFSSILVCGDQPCINNYEVRLMLHVQSQNNHEYNIAYQRVNHWFHEIMHESVMIDSADSRLRNWKDSEFRCIDFPTAPVDQVVGLMLMSKIQAMTEGRILVSQVAIASPRDDYVTYLCDAGDDLHWFDQPGWWNDPGPGHTTDHSRGRRSGKVISLGRNEDWKQHGLDWSVVDTVTNDNIAVISSFDRDDKDPVR